MSPLTEPTRIILRKGWQPMDPDAASYIAAVEAADGQALEEPVKIVIDNFVLGCKADGIWSAIKASCILAGARTLNGALVPLVGVAPTNFNFVAGDYDRKTGLVGNGSTKYLNSNRLASDDPFDNFHMSVSISTPAPIGTVQMYIGGQSANANDIYRNTTGLAFRSRSSSANNILVENAGGNTGFMGHSRSSSLSYDARTAHANFTGSVTVITADTANILVFARNNNGTVNLPTSARLAFYSIGESLDLALLDARVTDLINKFAEVLP